MDFNEARMALANVPHTGPYKGKFFYDLVKENGYKDVLELGFAHGCSTCYFAAALQDVGGHIDTVDRLESLAFKPLLEELSAAIGLDGVITAHREASSYTWWLKKKIEAQTTDGHCEPCYDLVFVDGPKDWTNDGAAFFMADKLLRPGGIMMFDDWNWTYLYREQMTGRPSPGNVFPTISEEKRKSPQVNAIFELLIAQHPNYSRFEVVDDRVVLARKIAGGPRTLRFTTKTPLRYSLGKAVKRLLRRR